MTKTIKAPICYSLEVFDSRNTSYKHPKISFEAGHASRFAKKLSVQDEVYKVILHNNRRTQNGAGDWVEYTNGDITSYSIEAYENIYNRRNPQTRTT